MNQKNLLDEKESRKRLGDLKKTDKIKLLKPVEDLLFEILAPTDIDVSYDVIASELPYFRTFGYTEWAGSLIIYPLCMKLRELQIIEAYGDKGGDVDFVSYLKGQVEQGIANKYKDRKASDGLEERENLVVLLGGNKLHKCVCLNKLKWVKSHYGHSIWFKPHPITEFKLIGELKDMFGENNVAHRDSDLYTMMAKAKRVFATHHSESVAFATALSKKVDPIDVYGERMKGAHSHVNAVLFDLETVEERQEALNRIFNSYKSGIINPSIDVDWEKKLKNYITYMMGLRAKYQDQYVYEPKKEKK